VVQLGAQAVVQPTAPALAVVFATNCVGSGGPAGSNPSAVDVS